MKEDQADIRIVKQARGQHIDLAVAAVIAYDRSLVVPPTPTTRIVTDEEIERWFGDAALRPRR